MKDFISDAEMAVLEGKSTPDFISDADMSAIEKGSVKRPGLLSRAESAIDETISKLPSADIPTSRPQGAPVSQERADFVSSLRTKDDIDSAGTIGRLGLSAAGGAGAALGSGFQYIGQKAGIEAITSAGERLMDVARARTPNNQTLIEEIAGGLGSIGAFVLASAPVSLAAGSAPAAAGIAAVASWAPHIAKGLSIAAQWSPALFAGAFEAAGNATETYDRVMEKTGDAKLATEQADKTFVSNVGLNTVLDKFGIFGSMGNYVKKVLLSGAAESIQEGTQQIITNIFAGDPAGKGAAHSALVGGLSGAGFKGVVAPFERADETQPPPKKTEQDILSAGSVDEAIDAFKDAASAPAGSFAAMDEFAGFVDQERADILKRQDAVVSDQQDLAGLVQQEQRDADFRRAEIQALSQQADLQTAISQVNEAPGEPTAIQLAMAKAQRVLAEREKIAEQKAASPAAATLQSEEAVAPAPRQSEGNMPSAPNQPAQSIFQSIQEAHRGTTPAQAITPAAQREEAPAAAAGVIKDLTDRLNAVQANLPAIARTGTPYFDALRTAFVEAKTALRVTLFAKPEQVVDFVQNAQSKIAALDTAYQQATVQPEQGSGQPATTLQTEPGEAIQPTAQPVAPAAVTPSIAKQPSGTVAVKGYPEERLRAVAKDLGYQVIVDKKGQGLFTRGSDPAKIEAALTPAALSGISEDAPTANKSESLPTDEVSGNIAPMPEFDNSSGNFNPDLDPHWIKIGENEINGDGLSDEQRNTAIAEYANQWRVDSLLEQLGFRRRGSSNVSSSTYHEKYDEELDHTYEVRVSDHEDRHPADSLTTRVNLNFRDGSENWSDVDVGPNLSTQEAIQRIKDALPNEALPNEPSAPNKNGASKSDIAPPSEGQVVSDRPEADEVSRAKEVLDAAGVTGTDRTTTIAAVRRGDLTADDVAEAHPANGESEPTKKAPNSGKGLLNLAAVDHGSLSGDPDPVEAERVQTAIEGGTVIGAAEYVRDSASNPTYRLISEKVIEQLRKFEQAGMTFSLHVAHDGDQVPNGLRYSRGVTWRAFDSDHTEIWLQGADMTKLVGMSHEVVLHELIHAVTQTAYYYGKNKTVVDKDIQAAVSSLFGIQKAVANHINDRITSIGRDKLTPLEIIFLSGHNVMTAPDEVLTWGFTNKSVQEYLESIPYESDTLWTKFVDAVRQLLGLTASTNTALSELLKAGETLLNANAYPLVELPQLAGTPHTLYNQSRGLLNQATKETDKGVAMFSRGTSTKTLDGSEFWRKIKEGESFTEKELQDAYSIGRRGYTRAGQSVGTTGATSLQESARIGFQWRGTIAGFEGYRTSGKETDTNQFTVYVTPEELIAQDGSDNSILAYVFTKQDNGKYRLDLSEPMPGDSAYKALDDRGRIETLSQRDAEGEPYYRVKLDDRYTTSRMLLQEAVRRLALNIGEVPTIVQAGRETGARANTSIPREFRADTIEQKFSSAAEPLANHHTPDTFKSALGNAIGTRLVDGILKTGKVEIITADQIPERVSDTTTDSNGRVLAYFDPSDGVTRFVADNIAKTATSAQIKGLALHEIGVHALNLGRNSEEFQRILRQFDLMAKMGNKDAKAAFARALEAGASEANLTEESLGYLIEAHPELPFVKRVLAWFRSAVRAMFGENALRLNAADLTYMAQQALKGAPETLGEQSARGGASMNSQARQTWYRSQLADAIDKLPPKIRTGNEMAIWLQANAAKLGIKQAEIEWSGVTDWLKMQGREKVSPEQVREFLDTNGVQVRDVVLGGSNLTPQEHERMTELIQADRNAGEQRELEGLVARHKGSEPKFGSYQLPGGENYKELLITLPYESHNALYDRQNALNMALHDKYGDGWKNKASPEEMKAYRDLGNRAEKADSNRPFRSSHFDQPNILAHIRMNDRTDAKGRKVLFLEELQSDWSASNRKVIDEVTKPEGIRELANNLFNRQISLVMPIEASDGGMLSALQNNQIRKAVIGRIPVDVMNLLRSFKAFPEEIFSKDSMLFEPVSMESRRRIGLAVLNAMREVGADLRAKLSLAYKAGLDEPLLPAMRASDLDTRVVVGLLSPSSLYHVGLPSGPSGHNVALPGAEMLSRSGNGAGAGNEAISTTGADVRSSGRSTGDGTKPSLSTGPKVGESTATSLADLVNWHRDILRQRGASLQGRYINAPFVSDTKAYTSLALKRAIAYAAEHGYDAVAWTTGEQQAARYDLSKQISRVTFQRVSGGVGAAPTVMGDGTLSAYDLNGKKVLDEFINDSREIEDYIGKDAAAKLAEQEGRSGRSPGGVSAHTRELSGLDLKVGGEGMKGYYDQIVPQVANDVLRKLGGEKVGAIDISAEQYPANFRSLEGARINKGMTGAQPGFAITPAMREQAGRGLPLFSRAPKTIPPTGGVSVSGITDSWQPEPVTGWDDFVRKMQDKLIDTKRVVQSIREASIAIRDEFDPYLQEVLYHGRAAKRVADFADNELRPLLVEMQARGVTMQEFDDYLWARHAAERNTQIAKINPDMSDGGSGLTNQEAADILAGRKVMVNGRDIELQSGKRSGYESLAKRVDAITKGTVDALVAYGLEKQETVDAWRGAYQHYVPLMRDMEIDDGILGLGLGTGQGFSVRGAASRRAMGSERTVVDVLANVAMQRERAITRGEKNRVAQAVLGLALTAENKDFWTVDTAPKELIVESGKTSYQVLYHGSIVQEFGNRQAAKQLVDYEGKDGYVINEVKIPEHVIERVHPNFIRQNNVLLARVDGEDHFVVFDETDNRAQHMVASLKNLDAEKLSWGMQMMAMGTRYLASINTQYNPVFGLVNGMRDLSTAMLNLSSTELRGRQKDVARNATSALAGIYIDLRDHRKGIVPSSQWAQLFEEFQREGGQTGYRDMFATSKERADAISDELKDAGNGARWLAVGEKRSHIFGWLSDYNTAIENALRLSAYKVAKDQGMSNAQAAALAKNLTVNFNKKGTAATTAGATYAFFNAAVQGTARIGETMFEHRGPMTDPKNLRLSAIGKKIMLGGFAVGVMQAVMGALADWDDEEPPQFVRERNFVIPLPGGKYITIPYPLGYHVIPNLGRVSTEFVLGGFKNSGKRLTDLAGLLADAFNPIGNAGLSMQTVAPTILDPVAALTENKDWTGKRIFREDFDKMHPTAGWTRTKDTASDLSKAISYGLNYITGGGKYGIGLVSPTPDQLDYLVGQATGGVGRETLKVWQAGRSAATGEELPMYKVPVAGRFVGETTGQASEANRFYHNLERIGEHRSTLKEMRDAGDSAAAMKYLTEHRDARMVKAADAAHREIAYLRRQKRDAIEKGASRERTKLMDERITAKMRGFNERVARLGKEE